MKRILLLALLCCITATEARKRTREEQVLKPVREIDRPLIAPVGMRTIEASFLFVKYLNYNKPGSDGFVNPLNDSWNFINLLLPQFHVSYSNSFEVQYTPLPVLRCLLLKNVEKRDGMLFITGPNIVFEAGFHGLSYSQVEGFNFMMHAVLECKFPVNRWLWIKAPLRITSVSSSPLIFVFGGLGTGIQIADRLALIPAYGIDACVNTARRSAWYRHDIRTDMMWSLNNYITVGLFGEGILSEKLTPKDITGGFSLMFNWF